MAITGISSYDGKQIIAAGAQSATKAYQDSNGDVITSKYQTTADMSNYIKNTDPVISVGFENTAINWSFGQGEQNDAVTFSLAQGNQNTALTVSFAQGSANYARGDSFAQGSGCHADQKSIAQGADCSAIYSAQAFGVGVVARTGMMAIGSYNNKTAYASFVIGNGTANDARSDIFYIDKSGNVSAAGKISANGVELGPGGAGVVTSTAGDGTYVTAINETPLSGAGGTQVVTSIHTAEYGVMAGTSATAVDKINGMGLFAQSGWSAVNAGWAKSAVSAYKDGNGRVIANTYQTTDGMTAYPNSADVTGTAQYGLTTAGWTEITGGGGGGYTGNAQEALDEVYSSSATWNTVTNKLDAASQVVTATGGTTTYVQTINGKNISATNAGSALSATNAYNLTNTAIKVASATSATTAYYLTNTAIKVASATSATNANTATYASNGVSLTDIYNSARSGYAASAYIKDKQIVNGRQTSYVSQSNPNWWTGNNIFGLKLNSASVFNSTGISIAEARVDGIELGSSGSNFWMLHLAFLFNKFIPINTATWNIVTTSFITTTGHFVAPVYSEIWTEWGAPFGAMMTTDGWATAIKLHKFEPWTGYTGDKVYVNYSIPWHS